MRYHLSRSRSAATVTLVCLFGLFAFHEAAFPQSRKEVVSYVQEQLGLNDVQARAGLGALLVFARDRLPKPQFDQLARRMPNADVIMQETHQRGIVTGPIDDEDDYERVLMNLGMGEEVAKRFGPAVLEYLGAAGYYEERDILSRVLD